MAISITGEVSTLCELDFDDLQTLPQVDNVAELVSGREGTAVRLSDVLARCSPKRDATHATLGSSDGSFTASVPLVEIADALLVYRLGDEPLPRRLGGPVRFLIPDAKACHSGGADVCANVKFLGSIELTAGERPDARAKKPHHA